jgi:hypothetical protein
MMAADQTIADEFALTVDAVFALAAAALAAGSPDEAGRLRSVARAQLAVCRVLSRHVCRMLTVPPADGEIVDLDGAAAAGSSDPAIAAPLTLSEEAAMAINSDTPIESSGIPGLDAGSWYATGAQGSTGSTRPDSSELGQATVAADPFQSGQGPRPMAAQGYGSTSNDSDPMKDVVSGTVTPPAVVAGATVAGPHHPNAGR